MKVAVFSTKSYDRRFLEAANANAGHELHFIEARLSAQTSALAKGTVAVCAFVNDTIDRETLSRLKEGGCRLVALRSAGFNNVDLPAAREFDIAVARVPAYSPYAVAEHTIALILALNRNIHRAYARVREGNFALEGLLGFDLRGRTAGIVGTGTIGVETARILRGFGCRVLGSDPQRCDDFIALGGEYVALATLLAESDIVSLHCPLNPATHHLIDEAAISTMKPGVMLINTSRGAVVDTRAVIRGLKSGQIGHLGLDVYEEEGDLFFEDLSDHMIRDDVFARLLTFPNVLITGHQAFFTAEALTAIAETTIGNITSFAQTGRPAHEVSVERIA
ncbi:2-hydroxyacid dehydrogenase [Sphingomonas mucosissima]|uniref:D-lactate dehydrogenase n=1 Tax=Sphingomonas mucosissima TaxID=370959 RepID=A0A245ZEY6_9SPHN|nr:2-hydroxyacid dehydrogenase [Sphingomonas mucosissima]OWK28301.1 D-lactate dehydrogenase [Sphingomonas mucosissima]